MISKRNSEAVPMIRADCEELRMKSLEDIKAYLLKGIELALDHLDRLSLRAKESEAMARSPR